MAMCNSCTLYQCISGDDIILHLPLVIFVSSLTRNQDIYFGLILELITKKLQKRNGDNDFILYFVNKKLDKEDNEIECNTTSTSSSS